MFIQIIGLQFYIYTMNSFISLCLFKEQVCMFVFIKSLGLQVYVYRNNRFVGLYLSKLGDVEVDCSNEDFNKWTMQKRSKNKKRSNSFFFFFQKEKENNNSIQIKRFPLFLPSHRPEDVLVDPGARATEGAQGPCFSPPLLLETKIQESTVMFCPQFPEFFLLQQTTGHSIRKNGPNEGPPPHLMKILM